MEIIDTHCHIDLKDFDHDRKNILSRCESAGINRLVVPAIKSSRWQELLGLCHQEKILYPAIGLHPVFIDEHQQQDLDELEKLLQSCPVIAVGEIGLDFFLKHLDKDKQQQYFIAQLQLAKKYRLPVILHVRKAHDDVLKYLKASGVKAGIVHAFNGSLQQAKQYIELGFKLGFGGTLTYKNASKIHKLAQELPLESIVLETDAPDMVTEQHKGERNSPEYIIESLTALAELRSESREHIAEQTTINANAILDFKSYEK